MLTNYFILVAAVTTASLVFRELKREHRAFKRFTESVPLIGSSLQCGFCTSLWLSLVGVLAANPLAWPPLAWLGSFASTGTVVVAWFAVGAGVLVLRSAIIVLLNLSAILSHQHDSQHAPGPTKP